MRILVTGVTGQVGGALVPRLQHLGTILPLDEVALDFTNLSGMAEILDRVAPDFIINPAAYTAVDKAEDEPELANRVNAEAPAVSLVGRKRHDVPLIHFSTDYVYDGHGDTPWREDDETRPLSVYGLSKLAGENEIRASGCCFLVVRTCWVYAAQGKNFLRTIARLAQERKAAAYCRRSDRRTDLGCTDCRRHCRYAQRRAGAFPQSTCPGRRSRPPRGLRESELAWFCRRDYWGTKGSRRAAHRRGCSSDPYR